jgi:hypothetical protein
MSMTNKEPKHSWRDVTIQTFVEKDIHPMKPAPSRRSELFSMILVLGMAFAIGVLLAAGF